MDAPKPRNFIELPRFLQSWLRLGLDDEDLAAIQSDIIQNREHHPVVPGSDGFRKVRFGRAGHGKSGGVRVYYVDSERFGIIILGAVYAKSSRTDLTKSELKNLVAEYRAVLDILETSHADRNR